MIYKKLDLRKEAINGFMPTLTAYILNDDSGNEQRGPRPAVVIAPGGGYGHCSKREAEPVALRYMAAGYHAFVLDYAVKPNRYPEALTNISDAVSLVRENADEWGVDKNAVAVMGFSAGGHLAGSLATMWDEEPVKRADGKNRPDAAILCYPVISSEEGVAHQGSFDALCGDDTDLREKMSLEKRVTEKTPPCFIWHTFEDPVVPVMNSLVFATALKKANVSCEMHIFPHGGHGLSVADEESATFPEQVVERVQDWVDLSVKWLDDLFKK